MYGRTKEFDGVPFSVDVFEEAISTFENGIADRGGKIARYECSYWRASYEETSVKNPDNHIRSECFSSNKFVFRVYLADTVGRLAFNRERTSLLVKVGGMSDLALADSIIHVFGKNYQSSRSLRDVFGDVRARLGLGLAAGG